MKIMEDTTVHPLENTPDQAQNHNLSTEVSLIQKKYHIVGRKKELLLLLIAIRARKHIILEGMVGTGKTYLARALAEYANHQFYRIDGSEDVLSHVLTGYFDPPIVLKSGYVEDAFIYGPLSLAMREGGCLFINELNRIPESTQNVLLSALDESTLIIPKLSQIAAKENFITIATQNPAAHVGVSALGEALKDRFVWIEVEYQPEDEEIEIVELHLDSLKKHTHLHASMAVKITDLTREHPDIRRGASIRGAIDLANIIEVYGIKPGLNFWKEAAIMALYSKIELVDGTNRNIKEILQEIVEEVFYHFQ
ncbi:MAG: MoxR family ATPase [Promethearchaeota archaeon]|nr:MAG: MoxR family ATPase [Candidatus Lokiarchaeota archaeon]